MTWGLGRLYMGRIALIGENSIEYINILLDIWNNGDCAVLLDYHIPMKTAISMMEEADVTICYIQNSLKDKELDWAINSIKIVTFDVNTIHTQYVPEHIVYKYHERYSYDEAVVIYSSGTTGKARGIILSHYAITTNADAIIEYMQPNEESCIYIIRPLSHSSALVGELLVALRTKCKLVVSPVIIHPRNILSNIEKFNVTILCLNPMLLSMLADQNERSHINISGLKKIYSSGSLLNDAILQKAKKSLGGINIYNVYGLTEAGPRVTAQRYENGISVGEALQNVEVEILDNDGKIVEKGNRGVIYVKTPSMFSGYILGEIKHKSLYEGWLNTGDVGYMDTQNNLYITGRVDDVIIIRAHKIYPSDIEAKICEIFHVSECIVIKVEFQQDNILACLYVSKDDKDIDFKRGLNKELIEYEIPMLFLHVENIPKSVNGKINRADVTNIIIDELMKYNKDKD